MTSATDCNVNLTPSLVKPEAVPLFQVKAKVTQKVNIDGVDYTTSPSLIKMIMSFSVLDFFLLLWPALKCHDFHFG